MAGIEFTREDHERLIGIEVKVESLDRLIASQRDGDQKALQIAQGAADKALILAQTANDKAADKANELRGVITEALGNLATKDYVDQLIRPLERAISETSGGASGSSRTRELGFSIVSALFGLAGFVGLIYAISH